MPEEVQGSYLDGVPVETGHRPYLSLGFYYDRGIHEAEVSAANGHTHQYTDGIEPFFQIGEVRSVDPPFGEAPGDMLTLVEAGTRSAMVSLSDIKLLHANLNDHIDAMRHAGMTDIQPSMATPRGRAHEGAIPKLITHVATSRGTAAEFKSNLESMTTTWNPADAILETGREDGQNYGYTIGNGLTLSDAMELDRDAFGPGGKSVTDIHYDAVVVNAERYGSFLSRNDASGGQ